MSAPKYPATAEEIQRARDLYTTSICANIEIDDPAETSDPADGTGKWIAAWVWLPAPEGDEALQG